MHAHYPDAQVAAALAPDSDQKLGHLLYQAATILVMLLFLVSFWSC